MIRIFIRMSINFHFILHCSVIFSSEIMYVITLFLIKFFFFIGTNIQQKLFQPLIFSFKSIWIMNYIFSVWICRRFFFLCSKAAMDRWQSFNRKMVYDLIWYAKKFWVNYFGSNEPYTKIVVGVMVDGCNSGSLGGLIDVYTLFSTEKSAVRS